MIAFVKFLVFGKYFICTAAHNPEPEYRYAYLFHSVLQTVYTVQIS